MRPDGGRATDTDASADARALVAWVRFLEGAGVDLVLGDAPRPWDAPSLARAPATPGVTPVRARAAPPASPPAEQRALLEPQPVTDARRLAAAATDMTALIEALGRFEGCPLARTAMNLCVGDGDPTSPFMLIGEAPGAEEDRQGKPFVGPSGKLLDRMLDAAGRPRPSTWITNTIYWRPPGNRTPTAQELAMCLPFLERQIELVRPKVILFVGGIAVRALLNMQEGVTRLRGRKLRYRMADGHEIPATVMFHPAYLLRRPPMKGLAWRDLLTATAMLESA